jgi:hypothetical protein
VYSTTSVIKHPKYVHETTQNDVGLVKLSKPLTLSSTVQIIKLVDEGPEPATGEKLTVTGWGNLDVSDVETRRIMLMSLARGV